MAVKEENPSSSPMESSNPIPDVEPTASTENTTIQQPVLPIIPPLVPPPVGPAMQQLLKTFPTNDTAVQARLRQLGEPIALFGEREMERRDRLQMIMVNYLDTEGQLEKLMKANEEEEEEAAAEESKHESHTERQLKRRRLVKGNEDEEAAAEVESKQVLHKLSSLSDAPQEALANVAGRLGLMDIFNFRGACKSFWNASDRFLGKLSNYWFLIYNENPCTLLTANGKLYQQHLPDLEGAICLASSQGWLLMFKEGSGSMFFFAPLSRSRIDIQRFPYPRLNGVAIAAFSSHPTSQHWKVAVIHVAERDVELSILECGSSEWSTLRFKIPDNYGPLIGFLHTPCGGFCHEGVFYFFDTTAVISYYFETKRLRFHQFIDPPSSREMIDADYGESEYLPFHRSLGDLNKVKQALGRNNARIETCGTAITQDEDDDIPRVILNERSTKIHGYFVGTGAMTQVGEVKGVWFTPESCTTTH